MSYKTILVHVDESPHSDLRIEFAARIAQTHNAHLLGSRWRACIPAVMTLTIQPVPAASAGFPECVIHNAACPTLIVPYKALPDSTGARMLIVWNGSMRTKYPVETIPDAVTFPSPFAGGKNHRPDHSIEARGITAAGTDGNTSNLNGHRNPCRTRMSGKGQQIGPRSQSIPGVNVEVNNALIPAEWPQDPPANDSG